MTAAERQEQTMNDDKGEFIQCPHEMIRATCAGVCMCSCGPCAPSRYVRSKR